MSANRQFVSVKFNPWDQKTYTYHWESFEKPLAPGDKVHVLTKAKDSDEQIRRTVEVESVDLPVPAFVTKPILGRAEQ